MRITVINQRELRGVDRESEYEVEAVPRTGEIVSFPGVAAARVRDVKHDLTSGTIMIWVR